MTIVIPALNEAHTLATTLSHTARLGFDHLVVVDGGSTDGTQAIVQSFSQSSMTLLTSPPGRAKQMNYGATHTSSDVLVFLHADTLLPGDARLHIDEALSKQTCVGGRFDVRFERDTGWSWLISRMMNRRSRMTGIATGDQAIFVTRRVFEQLGGFADIPLMEDIDFTRRLKQLGHLAAIRSKVVTSFRRWETQGGLRTIWLMWGLRFLYWTGVHPTTLAQYYRNIR